MRHLLLVVLLLGAPAFARADAVGPEPENCPNGSKGQSSHAGSWCEASTCATDADCSPEDGWVCRMTPLCVRVESYEPGGMRSDDSPPMHLTRHVAVSSCDASCPADAPCQRARRCVPPSLAEMFTPGAGGSGNGGCSPCTTAAGTATAPPRRRPHGVALYACVTLLALLVLRTAASRRPR